MANYNYIAKDSNGTTVTGLYTGGAAAMRQELGKLGYELVQSNKEKKKQSFERKIKTAEIVVFAYKFSSIYSAGLGVVRCLKILEDQADNSAFKEVLVDIREKVQSGASLEESFKDHSDLFSDVFIGLIGAGESVGNLAETLQSAATYLEKQLELKRKIMNAFAYPLMVGIMSSLVIGYLILFVVPVFQKIYRQVKVPLPWPTRMLLNLSQFLRGHWFGIIVVLISLCIGLWMLFRDKRVRDKWDVIKMRMPITGKINQLVIVSRFMGAFSMLSMAGMMLIDAITVAGRVTNNSVTSDAAKKMHDAMLNGGSLKKPMEEVGFFPTEMIHLTIAGEEAGSLPEMVKKGVDFLEAEIERRIAALLAKLEPVMTCSMGAVVGFILLAVYIPMFEYMKHIR